MAAIACWLSLDFELSHIFMWSCLQVDMHGRIHCLVSVEVGPMGQGSSLVTVSDLLVIAASIVARGYLCSAKRHPTVDHLSEV